MQSRVSCQSCAFMSTNSTLQCISNPNAPRGTSGRACPTAGSTSSGSCSCGASPSPSSDTCTAINIAPCKRAAHWRRRLGCEAGARATRQLQCHQYATTTARITTSCSGRDLARATLARRRDAGGVMAGATCCRMDPPANPSCARILRCIRSHAAHGQCRPVVHLDVPSPLRLVVVIVIVIVIISVINDWRVHMRCFEIRVHCCRLFCGRGVVCGCGRRLGIPLGQHDGLATARLALSDARSSAIFIGTARNCCDPRRPIRGLERRAVALSLEKARCDRRHRRGCRLRFSINTPSWATDAPCRA